MSSFLYLAPHGNWRQENGQLFFTLAIHSSLYFPLFGPAYISQSNWRSRAWIFYLLSFGTKISSWLLSRLNQRTAGDEGLQFWLMKNGDSFNHCWRPYKIASNVNNTWRTRTFKLQALYQSQTGRVPGTYFAAKTKRLNFSLCDGTWIARKHQTAKVWLYPKPAAEDLQRVVQSVVVRGLISPVGRW